MQKNYPRVVFFILTIMFFNFNVNNVYANCIIIEKIEIDGKLALSNAALAKILDPYKSKCITENEINIIVKNLSNKYIDEGYVASQIEVPDQDLKTKILKLKINSGVIESIEGNDISLANSFPNLIGKNVNLKDLELAVEQLNHLRSNNAKIELRPGKKSGSSKLLVKNEKTRRVYLSTGIDNSGDKNKGKAQGFAALTFENLINYNDSITLTERHNLTNRDSNITHNYNLLWVIPYNNYKVSFLYDYGFHKDKVILPSQNIFYSGKHNKGEINLSNSLLRNKKYKVKLNLGYKENRFLEKLENFTLDYQSYKFKALNVGISLDTLLFPGTSFHSEYSIEKGISHSSSEFTNEIIPNPGYIKSIIKTSINNRMGQIGENLLFSFQSSAKLQHSNHILYASEKFSLSQSDAVRGVAQGFKGDIGYNVRNELITSLYNTKLNKFFGAIELFTGSDFGRIYTNDNSLQKRGYASSVSAGFRSYMGMVSTSIVASKVLSCTKILSPKKPTNVFLSISVEV